MKKIGVVIASIAGIAGLIGVGWSLFNNSNEFVGFVTQQNSNNYYCNSYLPGDPGFKERLTTNNPTTKDDVRKAINGYLQETDLDALCDDGYKYKKDSFGYQQSKDKNGKMKKMAKWDCTKSKLKKGETRKNERTCIISW